jgi:hypothetical protein
MAMIRKQLYLEPAQDAKLKRLAASRGCTEAEVVREAIEGLPDPEPAFIQRLRERGLLIEYDGPRTTREEREAMLAALHARIRASGKKPRLTEAILEERDDSDRRF